MTLPINPAITATKNSAAISSGTSATVSSTGSVTAGNLMVVVMLVGGASQPTAFTAPDGTWTTSLATTATASAGLIAAAIFTKVATATGAFSGSFGWTTTATSGEWLFMEWKSQGPLSLDGSISDTQNASGTKTSPSVTPGAGNVADTLVCLTLGGVVGTDTLTQPGGMTSILLVAGTAAIPFFGCASLALSSASATGAKTWTIPTSRTNLGVSFLIQQGLVVQPEVPRARAHILPIETFWQGEPINSAPIQILSAVKFFGAGGQAPTKQWRYDLVPEPFWQGEPVNSAPLQILTEQRFFGAGGQAPAKTWREDYRVDDLSAVWEWVPPSSFAAANQPVASSVISRAPFYAPRPTDPASWAAAPLAVSLCLLSTLVAGTPSTARAERLDYFDAPVWQGVPLASPLVNRQRPFSKQWRYDPDVPPQWQGTPVKASTIQLLVEGGQPPTPRWRYDLAVDGPLWTWQGASIALTTVAAAEPFFKQWRYDPETLTAWTWQAPNGIVRLLTEGGQPPTPRWRYDLLLDAPLWSWVPPPATKPTQTNPFHRFWRYDQVDATLWQGSPSAPSQGLLAKQTAPFHRLWRWDLSTDALWSGEPRRVASLLTAKPLQATRWNVGYQEPTPWLYAPARSLGLLVAKPTIARAWRLDLADATWWSWAPASTRLIEQPARNPFPMPPWRADLADVVGWVGFPTRPNFPPVPALAVALPMDLAYCSAAGSDTAAFEAVASDQPADKAGSGDLW